MKESKQKCTRTEGEKEKDRGRAKDTVMQEITQKGGIDTYGSKKNNTQTQCDEDAEMNGVSHQP